MLGRSAGLPGRAAGVLPAALEREPAEHARLAGAGGRAADRVLGVGRVPEVGEHVHAAVLQVGRARVLVLVDHVLVERLGHQQPGLRLGPRRDERGQVEPRVAVEHQLVVDDLVGDVGVELAVRQPEARDVHRLPGEDRVDREVRAGVRRRVRGGHDGTVGLRRQGRKLDFVLYCDRGPQHQERRGRSARPTGRRRDRRVADGRRRGLVARAARPAPRRPAARRCSNGFGRLQAEARALPVLDHSAPEECWATTPMACPSDGQGLVVDTSAVVAILQGEEAGARTSSRGWPRPRRGSFPPRRGSSWASWSRRGSGAPGRDLVERSCAGRRRRARRRHRRDGRTRDVGVAPLRQGPTPGRVELRRLLLLRARRPLRVPAAVHGC